MIRLYGFLLLSLAGTDTSLFILLVKLDVDINLWNCVHQPLDITTLLILLWFKRLLVQFFIKSIELRCLRPPFFNPRKSWKPWWMIDVIIDSCFISFDNCFLKFWIVALNARFHVISIENNLFFKQWNNLYSGLLQIIALTPRVWRTIT